MSGDARRVEAKRRDLPRAELSGEERVYRALARFVDGADSSPHSFERHLLLERAAYLDAFVAGQPFPPFEVEIQPSSRCNLRCTWCMGSGGTGVKTGLLPDAIDEECIGAIVKGIIDTRINGLEIGTVRFAGFTGEPLVHKASTLAAMRALLAAGRQVGLFTNGVLMDGSCWETLARITYVHVSLDAGPKTYSALKGGPPRAFARILENIRSLHRTRCALPPEERAEIHVGYVCIPENVEEVEEVARQVRGAGADVFNFKCDITGEHDLRPAGFLDAAYEAIEAVQRDLHDPPRFCVNTIHSRAEAGRGAGGGWRRQDGCEYLHFLGTVASDGRTYLCDYNTLDSGLSTGSVVERPFAETWLSEERQAAVRSEPLPCRSSFCPPYANRVNFFLAEIRESLERHGIPAVQRALTRLRARCRDTAPGAESPAR